MPINWTALAERHAPFVCGIAGFVVHRGLAPSFYPQDEKELFSAVLNISGVAIGFLATGQGLLCSLSDNFVVQLLKKHKRFKQMLGFFTNAIVGCLFLAVFTLLSYFVPFKDAPILFSVWLGLFGFAFASALRVLILLAKILHGAAS